MIRTGYVYHTIGISGIDEGKEVEWSGLFKTRNNALAWYARNMQFWRARGYKLLLKEKIYNEYKRFDLNSLNRKAA